MDFRVKLLSQSQPRRRQVRKTSKRRTLTWLTVLIPVAIALFHWHAQQPTLSPQAVFVLGGAKEREIFAAEFARQHPHLPIWVSSGANPEYAEWVFSEAGIDPERVHLDYQAVDTVTNFTTLVDQLKSQGIESVYLITSDYHMRRAQWVGQIVFGSRGIEFQPIAVPSGKSSESMDKAVRDGIRAVLWVTTGYTGADLSQKEP